MMGDVISGNINCSAIEHEFVTKLHILASSLHALQRSPTYGTFYSGRP